MYPVPQVSDLAQYSGRAQTSYTAYATEALTQATIQFSFRTEVWSVDELPTPGGMSSADAQQLALKGICALADKMYLQQPYQAVEANPFQSETIGSYSYSKTEGMMARQFQGIELSAENTGVQLFDLAVQLFAKRTMAGGVFFDAITVFEEGGREDGARMYAQDGTGRRYILGPDEQNQLDIPWDVNSESFPHDPGI